MGPDLHPSPRLLKMDFLCSPAASRKGSVLPLTSGVDVTRVSPTGTFRALLKGCAQLWGHYSQSKQRKHSVLGPGDTVGLLGFGSF